MYTLRIQTLSFCRVCVETSCLPVIIGKKTCFYKKNPGFSLFLEDLKKSSCGTPELPKVTPPALNMLSSPWHRDDREWQYANFAEIYNYFTKVAMDPGSGGV